MTKSVKQPVHSGGMDADYIIRRVAVPDRINISSYS